MIISVSRIIFMNFSNVLNILEEKVDFHYGARCAISFNYLDEIVLNELSI